MYRLCHAFAQHALEVRGVMGLQHAGFAWQVEVPQARGPKAQSTGAQALLDLIAQGLCVVLVGAPVLAKAVQDLGQTIELLPVARQP